MDSASTSSVPSTDAEPATKKQPIAIITIGMAGAGKSTFVQRLNSHIHMNSLAPYILNLDPAVANLGYDANIDIRDTIDYAEVMKQSVRELQL